MRRLLLTHVRAVFTILIAALLLIGLAQAAVAHGNLEGGSPGPGDSVEPGSQVVRLDLDGADGDAPLAIALSDADDEPLAVGAVSVVEADYLCAATAPLTPGVWTLEYAGTGIDDDRFSGRYQFEVVAEGDPDGSPVDPGVCADADLAEPGEARTMAEMTDTEVASGVPAWAIWGLGALGLLAVAGVVRRVRADRAAAA